MTHNHDIPEPRPETLRERLLYHPGITLRGKPQRLPKEESRIILAALTLLAEIEQRAAARGYMYLVGWYGDIPEKMENIADFIAEIRGEVSG